LLFCWAVDVIAAEQQTVVVDQDSIALGRSIFESGIGRDARPIGATLHGIPLSGAAIACSGCHGRNARGGGEAFIVAPDIRWSSLAAGQSYDRFSFAKAIRNGHSADGRLLDPAMPRIDLADDEINSLIAYLTAIDLQVETANNRHHVIGLLPKPGHNSHADVLATKLDKCAASHQGIPIAAMDMLYFNTPEEALEKLESHARMVGNPVILMPFVMGWEEQYADWAHSTNIPTVLPFTFLDPPFSTDGAFEQSWHFYFPGLQSQLKALMKSIQREGYTHIHIMHNPADALSVRLNQVVLHEAKHLKMSVLTQVQTNDQQDLSVAVIWLMPTVMDSSIERFGFKPDIQMLVPVFFFNRNNIDMDSRFRWRVAYPYQPMDDKDQWLSPVDAWTRAACTFLANLNSSDRAKNDGLPLLLEWSDGFKLNSRLDPDSLSDTVFIHDHEK